VRGVVFLTVIVARAFTRIVLLLCFGLGRTGWLFEEVLVAEEQASEGDTDVKDELRQT
jgi:hypothetical protein